MMIKNLLLILFTISTISYMANNEIISRRNQRTWRGKYWVVFSLLFLLKNTTKDEFMTRTGHMIIFLGIFASVIASSHLYLFARISYFLQLPDGQRRFAALLLGG